MHLLNLRQSVTQFPDDRSERAVDLAALLLEEVRAARPRNRVVAHLAPPTRDAGPGELVILVDQLLAAMTGTT